jgi:hypothetical protein
VCMYRSTTPPPPPPPYDPPTTPPTQDASYSRRMSAHLTAHVGEGGRHDVSDVGVGGEDCVDAPVRESHVSILHTQ